MLRFVRSQSKYLLKRRIKWVKKPGLSYGLWSNLWGIKSYDIKWKLKKHSKPNLLNQRRVKLIKKMQDRSSFERLVLFVRGEIREFKKPINRNTLIEDNLGVTGDDAADMIQNFGKKFNVDISNFIFEKYFNDEPSFFLESRNLNPLTIGDLEKAIIAGHLDDDIINS